MDLKDIKVVILVGGMGTRLRPLTDNCPKPIVPVLNRPFLEHTLAHLKRFGIVDIILAMSYLPEAMQDYFEDGEKFGVRLTYCLEKEPLGSAGALKNAESYLDRPFVVLNGDNVFLEMDFNEVFTFHRKKRAKATIFMTYVDDPSAFGVVETGAGRRVKSFVEKPPRGTETTNWINAGGQILEPEVLEEIPPGRRYTLEKEVFPRMLETGQPVYGYTYKGYWLDMGRPQQYYNFNIDLLTGKTKTPLFQDFGVNGIYYGGNSDIHPTARITGPVVIDHNCKIGKDVCINGPAVIGKGCLIQDGVSLENVIVWGNVTIGSHSQLNHCIVSNDAVIAENRNIKNTVITPSRTEQLSV
jgi:mannose-1-phosphate guanylyltransferase